MYNTTLPRHVTNLYMEPIQNNSTATYTPGHPTPCPSPPLAPPPSPTPVYPSSPTNKLHTPPPDRPPTTLRYHTNDHPQTSPQNSRVSPLNPRYPRQAQPIPSTPPIDTYPHHPLTCHAPKTPSYHHNHQSTPLQTPHNSPTTPPTPNLPAPNTNPHPPQTRNTKSTHHTHQTNN